MARLWNNEVADAIKNRIGGEPITAAELVRITGLSHSTVRNTINMLRDSYLIEHSTAAGLNGHTIHRWYWIGEEDAE